MGAVLGIESAPSQAEKDNAALYPAEVLEALRACFDALAVGGVIDAARFKAPMLPAEGAQWSRLYQLMSQLDEPSSSDGPLHWPGFLAGVTAICKAFKSQRANTMARAYADDGTGLSDDALRRLLRHALVAARAGGEGGGDGGEGAALSPEGSFEGVLADVRRSRGSGTGTLTTEAWAKWVGLNLPALPACMEAFVLETLCAIGRQHGAARGRVRRIRVAARRRCVRCGPSSRHCSRWPRARAAPCSTTRPRGCSAWPSDPTRRGGGGQ